MNRKSVRNKCEQTLSLIRGKLFCSCQEPSYTGIPCRHLLALVSKDDKIDFKNLVFNERWKKSYFDETMIQDEPDELAEIESESENSDSLTNMSYISENEESLDFEEVRSTFTPLNNM